MNPEPIQPSPIETNSGEGANAAPRSAPPPSVAAGKTEDGADVRIEHHRNAREL